MKTTHFMWNLIIFLIMFSLITIGLTDKWGLEFGLITGSIITGVFLIFLLVLFIKNKKTTQTITPQFHKALENRMTTYSYVSGVFFFFGAIYNFVRFMLNPTGETFILTLLCLSVGFLFIFGGRMIARLEYNILRKIMFEK